MEVEFHSGPGSVEALSSQAYHIVLDLNSFWRSNPANLTVVSFHKV